MTGTARNRATAAERLLDRRGIPGVSVTPAGVRGEIAAVRAPAAMLDRLATLAPDVKALGFDYLALDLDLPDATGSAAAAARAGGRT